MRLLYYLAAGLLLIPVHGVPQYLIFNEHGIDDFKEWTAKLKQLRVSASGITSSRYSSVMSITSDYQKLFDDYLSLFQRSYRSDEFIYWKRFQIFVESLHRHDVLNRNEAKFNGTATYGINKFSDWTPVEFQTLLKEQTSTSIPNIAIPIRTRERSDMYDAEDTRGSTAEFLCTYKNIPHRESVDWRSKVTRVKDQGECGSCWAFVSSEQVESYWAIQGHPVVELSPQELLSCSPSLGCEGGNTCQALNWMKKNGIVLETEKDYPYEGQDSICQRKNTTRIGPKVHALCGCQSFVNHEEVMLKLVDQRGPLGVNVDAVLWHDYVSGIIQHHCTNQNMNHAVQIVGYRMKDGPVPYWLAKNQWGTSFGENGYIRIKYGDNLCGIAEQPSFIVV